MPILEPLISVDPKIAEDSKYSLVLHNDHVNSFDWVIFNLIAVCGHGSLQAEQCAMIVHNKGKYAVKHGDFDTLFEMCQHLMNNNLTVEIQSK